MRINKLIKAKRVGIYTLEMCLEFKFKSTKTNGKISKSYIFLKTQIQFANYFN